MAEVTYYNKEGLEKLKEELQLLKTEGRAAIARAIAEARDKGDLSENAEYDAAKEAQGMHEAKIAKLENTLATARLIDESTLDTSKVLALSIVKLKNVKNGQVMEYQLVSETEADLKAGKISVKSPIAQGLLGKSVGDFATIEVVEVLVHWIYLPICDMYRTPVETSAAIGVHNLSFQLYPDCR